MSEPKVSRRFEGGLVKQDAETQTALKQAGRALRFGAREEDGGIVVTAHLPDRVVVLASMPLEALVPGSQDPGNSDSTPPAGAS